MTIRMKTLLAFLFIAAVSAGSGGFGVWKVGEVRESIEHEQALQAEQQRVAELHRLVTEQELHLKRFVLSGERAERAGLLEKGDAIAALSDDLTAAGDASPELAKAVDSWRAWRDGHVALITDLMKRPETIELARLEEAQGAGLSHLRAFHEGIDAVDESMFAALSDAARNDLWISAEARLVVMIGAGVVVVSALLLGVMSYRHMQRIGQTMAAMEAGEVDAMSADERRGDEIGSMARAAGAFRARIEKIEEAEVARKNAEAEREVMLERLRSEFGAVVSAGIEGDFSKRVSAHFADETLATLATGVNDLMASVDRGVDATVAVARRLSEGDLTVSMTGAFAGAFRELQTSLNLAVESTNDLVKEIGRSVAETEHNSTQIKGSAEDLSQRAESQAASLEETAATMTEMTETIRANAANAERAQSMAAETTHEARQGGEIVSKTMSAMERIESSSTQIADIVSMIDGIAFQTNLLALNAAVEPARAGEAGKGFAVVASEVRSLAQRSTDAARDISPLIQRSSEDVASGADLMRKTGDALKRMTTSIEDVAGVISDISMASREQTAGVEEISGAVNNMDQITQQNAVAADETARSAGALVDATARLSAIVGRFRTRTGEDEMRSEAA